MRHKTEIKTAAPNFAHEKNLGQNTEYKIQNGMNVATFIKILKRASISRTCTLASSRKEITLRARSPTLTPA
jgi:hypothetical protein